METGREPPRLYRFGFVATTAPAGFRWRPSDRWREEKAGGLTLLLHEEAEVRRLVTPAGAATVLGTAFAVGGGDVDAALARLIDAAGRGADVNGALDGLGGRFCALVEAGGATRAYLDPIGARSLFHAPGDRSVVASHAGLLAGHLGARPSAEAAAFIRTPKFQGLSVKYLPGDMTMWDEVKAMVPNHAFAFGAPDLERHWPLRDRPEQGHGFDALLGRAEVAFAALARGLGDRPAFIGVTGGIDTRLLLAGLAGRGLDLRAMTWLGPFHDPRERPIVEEVVARMGLPHAWVPVPGVADEVAVTSGKNSGGYRGRSRLTSGIATTVGEVPGAVFLRGYGGEVMRGFYNLLPRPLRDGSAAELARIFALKSSVKDPDPAFDRVVLEASEAFAARAGYAGPWGEALAARGYDVNDVFYWEQRMGGWGAAMHNEMDAAMPAMTGLNDRAMFDMAYGLPRGERLTKALFQRLIEAFEPRLAGLPIA